MRPTARVRLEVPREHRRHAVVVGEVAGEQPPTLHAVGAVPHRHRLARRRRRVQARAARREPPSRTRRRIVGQGIGKAVVDRDACLRIAAATSFANEDGRGETSDEVVAITEESREALRVGHRASLSNAPNGKRYTPERSSMGPKRSLVVPPTRATSSTSTPTTYASTLAFPARSASTAVSTRSSKSRVRSPRVTYARVLVVVRESLTIERWDDAVDPPMHNDRLNG